MELYFRVRGETHRDSILRLDLMAEGRLAATAPVVFMDRVLNPDSQQNLTTEFQLPPHVIAAIEAQRQYDVQLEVRIDGQALILDGEGKAQKRDRVWGNLRLPYSQKKWLDLLKAFGYRDGWVVEVSRPDFEGMTNVKEHLDRAAEALQKREYLEVVRDCRTAMDAFGPLLTANQQALDREIDRLSPGETNRPPKSRRIGDLRRALEAWANIGPHTEAYTVTPEDALLCYRQTVSLVSYLAAMLKRATTAGSGP